MRVAVVTPYYEEPIETLRRCFDSVLGQTYPVTHIFVADGKPREILSEWNAQHIKLPASHGDGGNTPRSIGAISAINQGFDAIAFLDADNWYAPDHICSCMVVCKKIGVDVVFSSRQIVLSTGQMCNFNDRDEVEKRHVDTSCFFITARAAYLLPLWAMIQPSVAVACDRIMLSAIRARNVSHAWTERKTVYYTSRYRLHFLALGLAPPVDEHRIDWAALANDYNQEIMTSQFGFDPRVDLARDVDYVNLSEADQLNCIVWAPNA